ncbi:response regulator transcription factor [Weissella confusa]|uniref:response regulator transcription factor n=1 Tax=Weissella confusa TaxID=1583 RepID=UPI0022E2CA56|nr:response regulator transcription factor [Weissella confusa]
MTVKYNVLIVDDHPLIIDSLVRMFDSEEDFKVVGTAESSREGLSFLKTNQSVDIIIFDFRIPDMNGYDFVMSVLSLGYTGKLVLLTMMDDQLIWNKMTKTGVNKIISKSKSMDEILLEIKEVATREKDVARPARQMYGKRVLLTDTEKIILTRISQGHHTTLIATELGISPRTVKYRLTEIFNKLGASNRSQAIALAIKEGIISL